ncbi:arylsulfatase B-like [Ptychodera flava]|uniref:arylsulfatase B-like n=1 Tax=Ptychodera flava TaxID=63121 RepID=UPI003969FF4A
MKTVCILLSVRLWLATVQAAPRPHIVFILADDLGWDDVGYHGSIMKTPNIDALAAGGVKLENYYMPSLCTPSRSVLLTGRYEIHTGLQHGTILMLQPLCLPFDEITLPQKLKEYGYSTNMVGKWHLGFYTKNCLPNHRGFDNFLGFYQAMEDYYYHNISTGSFNGWDFRRNDEPAHREYNGKYSTHIYAQEAENIIMNHDETTPLFLYLSFQAVHTPLQVPSEYSDMYKDIIPNDESRRTYAGMVTCMDEAVGNVTMALQKRGLWENTVLIFSTDNGGLHFLGSNWPLRGGKGTLYEGGVHGVGFVNSPLLSDQVRGTVSHELIHISDWFPTLIQVAGGNLIGGRKLDGYNQWETISQGAPSVRQEMLLHIDPLYTAVKNVKDDIYSDNPYFNISMRAAIRVCDWKLITGAPGNASWMAPSESGMDSVHPEKTPGKAVQLYNIAQDPYEKYNLAEAKPDIVIELLWRLRQYYNSSVPPNFPQQDVKHANPALFGGVWSPWQ